MRNDTRDERTQPEGRPIAAAGERQANRPAAGATVSIPPRPRSADAVRREPAARATRAAAAAAGLASAGDGEREIARSAWAGDVKTKRRFHDVAS